MENRSQPQPAKVNVPQPIRNDGAGATDFGPRDIMRDLENADMLVPPATDAGTIPNLKFSFSDAPMQLNHGGWSRQVTVRELPINQWMALTPRQLVQDNLHARPELMTALRKQKWPVVKYTAAKAWALSD
jgi:hypothetical protein